MKLVYKSTALYSIQTGDIKIFVEDTFKDAWVKKVWSRYQHISQAPFENDKIEIVINGECVNKTWWETKFSSN